MTKIEIKDLSILFGPEKAKAKKMIKQGKSKQEILKETGCTIAVRNANLEIKEGEMFVIMGLSGSGKSTLVRCINRLNEPSMGEIWLSGRNITSLSDKELLQIRRKEMAMVFQHFGLLPHRTVLSNIAFGLELQGVPKEEREKKAYESIAVVGLKGYENQRVDELSGGMQQRVGLARALANDPEVLLMDEAFSALDPLIREQMQDELLDLQEKMKRTIVFITHDLDEAIKLGDRIAIMKDGEVVQVGTPEEILTDPANDYVTRFTESVDRGRVVTASSIMLTQPIVVRIRKDGPEAIIRKMREKRLYALPVIGADEQEGNEPSHVSAGRLERGLGKGSGGILGNARLVKRELGEDGKHNEHEATRHMRGDWPVLIHEECARKDEERYGHEDRASAKALREQVSNCTRHDSRGWGNQRDEHGDGHHCQNHAEDVVLR